MNRRHLFRSLLGMACAPLVAVLPKEKPQAELPPFVPDYDANPDGYRMLIYEPARILHTTAVHRFRITASDPGVMMMSWNDGEWVCLTEPKPPIGITIRSCQS